MRQGHSSNIEIPEGFASLEHARSWEDGLCRAEKAMDSLGLQKCLYALKKTLRWPRLLSLAVYASVELPGIEVCAMVEGPCGPLELGVLLVQLFRRQHAAEPSELGEMARQMEALRTALREIEQWTRERPGIVGAARRLGASAEREPVMLRPAMGWREIAYAVGAEGSSALMEKAQISHEALEASGSESSKRL